MNYGPRRYVQVTQLERPIIDRIPLLFAESIADIDLNITTLQNSLFLYPRSHPEHINCVYNLAEARWKRYRLSREKKDLDKSILHFTMAILLPPVSRDGLFIDTIFDLLFLLAYALIDRYEEFEQSEGIKYAIEYLRFLRGSTLDSLGVSRNLVTTSLVKGLGIQVEAGDGDGTRSVKEMVELCRELLTSNSSTSFPDAAFKSLNVAADADFNHGLPMGLLDEVVECLRDAVKVCPPDSFPTLFALAKTLHGRYRKTHSLDDYEEAMALLENILDPNRPGECPDSIRSLASARATRLAFTRFATFKNPEHLEVAISRLRVELSSPSIHEFDRVDFSKMLSILVKARFLDYSLSESLEEANSNSSQIVSFHPLKDMGGYLHQ